MTKENKIYKAEKEKMRCIYCNPESIFLYTCRKCKVLKNEKSLKIIKEQ